MLILIVIIIFKIMSVFNNQNGYEVILNVYDLSPNSSQKTVLNLLGIGFYHSGVEINGVEYTYGGNFSHSGTGVYQQIPLMADGITYKESFLLGVVKDMAQV